MKKKLLLTALFCAVLAVVAVVLFATLGSAKPMAEVAKIVEQDDVFEGDGFYRFSAAEKNACLIFYPGGLVEPLAYAPLLQQIATAGFSTYLLELPLNLAVFDANAADRVKADGAEHCSAYVVGGHSLGGVMAAGYVLDKMDHGLLLLAAYPQASKSLAAHPASVLSISASLDGLSTPAKVAARDYLLPQHAQRLRIDGGNHAQFGWYGQQRGDLPALISRDQQQALTATAMIEFMQAF